MKALVAGRGFIGSTLVAKLVDRGCDVTVMSAGATRADDGVRLLKLADWHPKAVMQAETDPRYDWVFNLTAYGVNPNENDRQAARIGNVDLPVAMAELAARSGATAYVHTGSMFEYAEKAGGAAMTETDPTEPEKIYGQSKAEGSAAVVEAASRLGISSIVARVFGVYGENERPWRLLPSLYTALRVGRSVPLTEGTQVRDLLYVDDVADGLIALASAARAAPRPQIVNLCSGEGVSVRRFAEVLADAVGASRNHLLFGAIPMRAHEIMYLVGDASRLNAATDWRPAWSLEAGIAAACAKLAGTHRGAA